MKVDESKYSIGEIVKWYKERDLIFNDEYQRGGGLWPPAAKSCFIDTIIKEFPFPKMYFHKIINRKTRKPYREIVDSQQRLTTIVEFVDGKFALGRNALGFEGIRFQDLDVEKQDTFYAYPVLVDVIRNANRSDILQMFRRMNAFTLPLNAAEKRHSEFFGEFKDWVNIILDRFGSTFVDLKILTSRQIVRMADAEFIADLALAIRDGIVSTSPAKLASMYKTNDNTFEGRAEYDAKISDTFDTILTNFSQLQGTYLTLAHIFHSFFCALMHNRFGLPGVTEATGVTPTRRFFSDKATAMEGIKRLVAAHEERDRSRFGEYVQAASEGGNRAPQRTIRIKWLCNALQGRLS